MRPRARLARALALALVACAPGAAAPGAAQEPEQSVELSSEVVEVPLTVGSSGSATVGALAADDFEVRDGDATPEIAFFRRDVAPVDVALMVDTSASTGSTLPVLEQAAGTFAKHLRREDAYTLFTFSDRPSVAVPWTSDPSRVAAAFKTVKAEGVTLLNMSAYVALSVAFDKRPADRRRALVLLTDGIDTGGGFYTFSRVEEAALARDVTVYVVSVNRLTSRAIDTMIEEKLVPMYTWRDYRTMQEELGKVEPQLVALAEGTGGRVLFPKRNDDLSPAYEAIGEELRSRYLLGFYAPQDAAPGYRAINVRAKRQGLTVRARAGYVVGEAQKAEH